MLSCPPSAGFFIQIAIFYFRYYQAGSEKLEKIEKQQEYSYTG
jgi:hypothetical protein